MKVYSIIFVLTFGFVTISKCESGFDAALDDVLKYFNDKMRSENKCSKGLPNESLTITKKFGFIPVKVHVSATGGNVKDLCSFRRSGDVQLTQTDQSTVTLSLGIDMDDLEINYNDLSAKAILIIYINFGSLKAIINKHAIEAQITVSIPSPKSCSINLDFVKVKELGDIHVFTAGKENSKFDNTANSAVNSMKGKVTSAIESKIKSILSSEDVCKKILERGITLQ